MIPPVYPVLSTFGAVTSIVSTRIYPHGTAPQGVAAPYVTYSVVVGTPVNVMSETPGIDSWVVQINCWSDTTAQLVALATAVRDAMEQLHALRSVVDEGRDPDTGRLRYAMQFDMLVKR